MTSSGWTCSDCGTFVPGNQSHTCRTVPAMVGTPIESKPLRYRIHGSLVDLNQGGRKYEVDLIVEPLP